MRTPNVASCQPQGSTQSLHRQSAHLALALAACAGLLGASRSRDAAAQPASESAFRASPQQDPGPVGAGARALAAGAIDEAERHFRAALEAGADLLAAYDGLLAVAADKGDGDLALVLAHERALIAVTPRGAVPGPPRGTGPTGPGARWPNELAKLRAAAAFELTQEAAQRTRGVARDPSGVIVAAWLRRLALDIAQPSPEVAAALADGLDPLVHPVEGGHIATLKALDRVMTLAHANGRNGEAVRAARVLHGLGVQAEFDHLAGERPAGMARWRAAGAAMLARARERLDAEHPEPWTVDELEWLSSNEGEAFTRQHASFALPGVAVSPRGWYRIESDCGYETLLGVARTIEDHHRRLARWFGEDPFIANADSESEKVLRRGLVRIVPNADGLEAEGAPYFWVGGFQAGDTTVLRFSVGDIEGLGHGLTHELTHRFDGALHPGLPTWAAEGKAVWTGAAYGRASDLDFVPHHAAFGTMDVVRGQGYGGVGKLRALVSGRPEDYRENYSAGYALVVYLNTWQPVGEGDPAAPLAPERALYRERWRAFQLGGARGAKAGEGRDRGDGDAAVQRFTEAFCDGAAGRPANLDEFAVAFGEFLAGFHWREPAPWRPRYTEDVPRRPAHAWVYDDPTWVWSWQRAEPTFGQDQARLAGELMLDVERSTEAVAALVWARSQDGYVPRTNALLLRALAADGRAELARWVLNNELTFPGGAAAEPLPGLSNLRATGALLAGYEAAADAAPGPRARAVFAAEHARLAAWLGVPRLAPVVASVVASGAPAAAEAPRAERVGEADDPAVDERAPRALGSYEDAPLVGYDEHRPSRAFATEAGDLLLGRRADRTGTGRFDRNAGALAFALADAWQLPGTYRVRTRVRFTTGFSQLECVIGYTRRDRNVRFRITAGDYLFAIGETDEEPAFDAVQFGFSGSRDRDAGLRGATPAGEHRFGHSQTVVEVELLVDGASVTAYLDGVEVASYHTIDGAPIAGRVGFGVQQGAVRLERPNVQRLDRGASAGRPLRAPRSLDLARLTAPDFGALRNLPLRGLPRCTTGRLVMWFPADESLGDPAALEKSLLRIVERFSERAFRGDLVQPLTLIVPARCDVGVLAKLGATAGALDPPVEVVTHRLANAARGDAPDGGRQWLLFVDAAGVVRVTLPWVDGASMHEAELAHWLRAFKENGAPVRDLPPLERPK